MKSSIVRGRLSHKLFEDFRYLLKSLVQKRLTSGAEVQEFQTVFKRILNRNFCVSFQFARTGLYFSLKSLDLPKGTKVIMPSIMIKAYLDVVLELELEPVFVDNDTTNGGPDLQSLRKAIDSGGRVLILVYLFGLIPNLNAIKDLTASNNVFVIEDFSQAIDGSFQDKRSGTFGEISIYSSSAVKIVDTFGGGHVFCDDRGIYDSLKEYEDELSNPKRLWLFRRILLSLTRNLVSQRVIFSFLVFPAIRLLDSAGKGSYVKFVGSRSFSPIEKLPDEWFAKFTDLQAKIGLSRLAKFELENSETHLISKFYDSAIHAKDRMYPPRGSHSYRWQYIFYHSDFSSCRKQFLESHIDVAQTSLVNLSSLPEYGWNLDLPGATKIYKQAIYIPFYKELNTTEAERVVGVVKKIIQG